MAVGLNLIVLSLWFVPSLKPTGYGRKPLTIIVVHVLATFAIATFVIWKFPVGVVLDRHPYGIGFYAAYVCVLTFGGAPVVAYCVCLLVPVYGEVLSKHLHRQESSTIDAGNDTNPYQSRALEDESDPSSA